MSRWPPVSVWLAVLLLVGSPAGLLVYAANGRSVWLCLLGVFAALAGVFATVGLLRRSDEGPGDGERAAYLTMAIFGLLLWAGGLRREPVWAVGCGLVVWGGGVTAAVRWPETRRWCRLLPPRESEDDA